MMFELCNLLNFNLSEKRKKKMRRSSSSSSSTSNSVKSVSSSPSIIMVKAKHQCENSKTFKSHKFQDLNKISNDKRCHNSHKYNRRSRSRSNTIKRTRSKSVKRHRSRSKSRNYSTKNEYLFYEPRHCREKQSKEVRNNQEIVKKEEKNEDDDVLDFFDKLKKKAAQDRLKK
jgi:hypothetical protein